MSSNENGDRVVIDRLRDGGVRVAVFHPHTFVWTAVRWLVTPMPLLVVWLALRDEGLDLARAVFEGEAASSARLEAVVGQFTPWAIGLAAVCVGVLILRSFGRTRTVIVRRVSFTPEDRLLRLVGRKGAERDRLRVDLRCGGRREVVEEERARFERLRLHHREAETSPARKIRRRITDDNLDSRPPVFKGRGDWWFHFRVRQGGGGSVGRSGSGTRRPQGYAMNLHLPNRAAAERVATAIAGASGVACGVKDVGPRPVE
jgi:hypothetical protein